MKIKLIKSFHKNVVTIDHIYVIYHTSLKLYVTWLEQWHKHNSIWITVTPLYLSGINFIMIMNLLFRRGVSPEDQCGDVLRGFAGAPWLSLLQDIITLSSSTWTDSSGFQKQAKFVLKLINGGLEIIVN